MRAISAVLWIIAASLLLAPCVALAQERMIEAGGRLNLVPEGSRDVWAAGGQISVLGTVRDNVWVTGGSVEIDVVAGGDVLAGGGAVDLRGDVANDAWIAAGSIDVAGHIGRSLQAAGANIVIRDSTEIDGDAAFFGAVVTFSGLAKGPVSLRGRDVIFAGRAQGNVVLEGRSVRIADGALIQGDVIVRSANRPLIAPGAKIIGTLTQEPGISYTGGRDWSFWLLVSLTFALSAFAVGGVLILLMPTVMATATGNLANRPVLALVNGLLAAIGGTLVALGLLVTLVAAPLGGFLLLAFPLLALLGHAIVGYTLSDRLFGGMIGRKSVFSQFIIMAVGVILVAIVGLIPIIGWLLVLLLLVVGVGAALLAFAEHLFGLMPKRAT